jgi:beta-N-acetylglucosaminidase
MGIAAHESAWGSNAWSKRYNNVMSWGISDSDPDRAYYPTKTLNVLAAAQGLKRLYLTEGATYYGGDLTLWGVNKYYASDKGWADGVVAIIKILEQTLTETQRMKRWCVKTGLFQPNVAWDDVHTVVGWSLYKTNNNKTVMGR